MSVENEFISSSKENFDINQHDELLYAQGNIDVQAEQYDNAAKKKLSDASDKEKEKRTLRWRLGDSNNIESNAKIVFWSDKSVQLVVGDEYFDLDITESQDTFLYKRIAKNYIMLQKQIEKKSTIQAKKKD